MRSLLKNTIAFLAATSLGGVALLSGGAAFAQAQPDQQNYNQEKPDQQKSDKDNKALEDEDSIGGGPSDQQAQTPEQKAKYFSSWAKSTKAGQAYNIYAVEGLMLIHTSLSSIIEAAQTQPIGGGPDAEQAQSAVESLKEIRQNQQKIEDLTKKLKETGDLTVRPQQFQLAAASTAEALNALQQMRFPKLDKDVKKVRKAVDKIDVEKPLAAQSRDVERFFKSTSDAITKMSDEMKKQSVGGGPAEEPMQEQKTDQPDQQQPEGQPEEQNEPKEMNQ